MNGSTTRRVPGRPSNDNDDLPPGGRVLECWLRELERLDSVLEAQTRYLDAIELGEDASPPEPFVGTPGLPVLPGTLGPYARDLVARNEAVTRRAMALSAQLRPRRQRPMAVVAVAGRGARFEHLA